MLYIYIKAAMETGTFARIGAVAKYSSNNNNTIIIIIIIMRYNRVTTGKLTKPVNKLVKQLAVFLQGYVPDLYIRGTPLSSAFQDGSSPFLGHHNRTCRPSPHCVFRRSLEMQKNEITSLRCYYGLRGDIPPSCFVQENVSTRTFLTL